MNALISNFDNVLGICRILFGVIGILKVSYLIQIHDVNWAFDKPLSKGSYKPTIFLLSLFLIFFVLLTLGVQSAPSSLFALIIFIYTFHYSAFYGLENILMQMLLVYFSIAGPGNFALFDQFDLWGRLPHQDSYLPEYAIVIAIGLSWMSASIDKIKDPIWWKDGLGVYYFFLLPQWRRCDTSFITKRKWACYFLNYFTIAFQLTSLPIFLFYYPLGWVFSLEIFLFAFALSTVFILTWVGEILAVGSILMVSFFLLGLPEGIYFLWKNEIMQALASGDTFTITMHFTILTSLIFGFYNSCIAVLSDIFQKHKVISKISNTIRYINRYTWGFCPFQVFTSVHIAGPALFRFYVTFDDGKKEEVFKINKEGGFPHPWRYFKPSMVDIIAIKISESCMEYDAKGIIPQSKWHRFILRFCDFLGRTQSNGKNIQCVEFQVIQLVPPSTYNGADDWYMREEWVPCLKVEMKNNKAQEVVILQSPILRSPTGRSLDRDPFNFADNVEKSIY